MDRAQAAVDPWFAVVPVIVGMVAGSVLTGTRLGAGLGGAAVVGIYLAAGIRSRLRANQTNKEEA